MRKRIDDTKKVVKRRRALSLSAFFDHMFFYFKESKKRVLPYDECVAALVKTANPRNGYKDTGDVKKLLEALLVKVPSWCEIIERDDVKLLRVARAGADIAAIKKKLQCSYLEF